MPIGSLSRDVSPDLISFEGSGKCRQSNDAGSHPRLKHIAVALLMPVARAVRIAERGRRAWAYARLQAELGLKIDSSIVILGVPEIRGTARITLGRGLLLYRGLYFETRES